MVQAALLGWELAVLCIYRLAGRRTHCGAGGLALLLQGQGVDRQVDQRLPWKAAVGQKQLGLAIVKTHEDPTWF